MSHKSAKKVRKLLKRLSVPQTEQPDSPRTHNWQERQYVEDQSKRKRQRVELKSGEEKVIDVSQGQITLRRDSGRGFYKMVKAAIEGKVQGQMNVANKQPPRIDIREVEVEDDAPTPMPPYITAPEVNEPIALSALQEPVIKSL